jgi:uncharacterized protein YkwD
MTMVHLILCASMLVAGDAPASGQQPQPKGEQKAAKATEAKPAQPAPSQAPAKKPATPKKADPAKDKKDKTAAPVPPELEIKEMDGVKLETIEANVVSYTNEERARYGLPPLQVDKELMDTAREHAAWMTRNYSMVHTWRPLAENIAMGQPHSSDAVRAWMNSSGHRANILNSGHRCIGVGAYRTESGTIFWCQQFRQ